MLNFHGNINITGNHKYNSNEMKTAISEHFHEICYLCDNHIDPILFQVEHFKPKSKFKEEKNNPENLFYSCSRCNGIKSLSYNTKVENEILNSKIDDVENLIVFSIDTDNKEIVNKINISYDTDDENLKLKCENTKELLNKIYNADEAGVETSSIFEVGKFRQKIKKESERFNNLLRNLEKKGKLKNGLLRKIKKHIIKQQK